VYNFFHKYKRTYTIINLPNLKLTRYYTTKYSSIPAFFKQNNYFFGKSIKEHLFSYIEWARINDEPPIIDDRYFVDKIKLQQKALEQFYGNFTWIEKWLEVENKNFTLFPYSKNFDKRLDVFNNLLE
jgi:hypothetical protein